LSANAATAEVVAIVDGPGDLGSKIAALKALGLSHKAIAPALGCSLSTVSYHLNPSTRDKTRARVRKAKGTVRGKVGKKLQTFRAAETKHKNRPGRPPIAATTAVERRDPVRRSVQMRITPGSKAKKRGHTPIDADLDAVMEKINADPRCYLTGDAINLLTDSWALDHIHPRSRGGPNTLVNVGLTTATANSAKGDMTLGEFLHLCEKVLRNHGYEVRPSKAVRSLDKRKRK